MDDLARRATEQAALTYPFAEGPGLGDGTAIEVRPGVLWLRMPLFVTLPWINVWAIDDGEGWAIVDTGLRSTKTTAGWTAAFGGALGGRPVTRVIATHMHPDHCGMAAWIAGRFDVMLWMTKLEYLTCRVLAGDTGKEAPRESIQFYRAAGWPEPELEQLKARFGAFGEAIYPLPPSYRRLADGDILTLGAHQWQIVVGSGHSPEHACLYCPDLKLLISGDQILPRITSNVSVFPTEPMADPVEDFTRSLARIRERLPDDLLVLPAHNFPFTGLYPRIDQLIRHHERSLDRLEQALAEPKRAVDLSVTMFGRNVEGGAMSMATGETIAHLNRLEFSGRATRSRDAEGVDWWRAVAR